MHLAPTAPVADDLERSTEQLTYRFALPFEKIVDKYCAYGPPSRIVECLGQNVEAGANKLIVGLVMPPEDQSAWIERFAGEISPELKQLGSP